MTPTIIIRHHKENLKKCSLRGLESREDFCFLRFPFEGSCSLPNLDNYVLLSLDGPVLSEADRECGLILLDATWRYADKMDPHFSSIPKRTLPSGVQTAYPRCQNGCSDPDRGLASIEALYVAYDILGWETAGLLDNYYWKQTFLANYTQFC